MPVDEEIFEEPKTPHPEPQYPKAPEPPDAVEPIESTLTQPASFKQMLAAETDDESDDNLDVGYSDDAAESPDTDESMDNQPEDNEVGLATTQLASARTAVRRHFNPIKKGLSSLRPKKESKEKEMEADMAVPEGQLAIDVYETPNEVVIKSTIAGVKPQDLDVGIEENTINIRGSRHNEEKVKGEDYFYQECYWGTFSRSVILPVEVDVEKAEATLKDGILTIRLQKILREKERKIKILS